MSMMVSQFWGVGEPTGKAAYKSSTVGVAFPFFRNVERIVALEGKAKARRSARIGTPWHQGLLGALFGELPLLRPVPLTLGVLSQLLLHPCRRP